MIPACVGKHMSREVNKVKFWSISNVSLVSFRSHCELRRCHFANLEFDRIGVQVQLVGRQDLISAHALDKSTATKLASSSSSMRFGGVSWPLKRDR
jgi:hypothetical protein